MGKENPNMTIKNNTLLTLGWATLLIYFTHIVQSLDPDKVLDNIRAHDPAYLEQEGLGARGRVNNYRQPLPDDVTNLKGKINTLNCEDTYAIQKEGYLTFKINSKSKSCRHTFLGSKVDRCTVTLLCNGKMNLAPPSERGCTTEWLAITDGTEGRMSGCGTFHFGFTPRLPRNNGTDLYLYYKGAASSATCAVFCIEDLKRSSKNKNVKEAKPISQYKKYQGLQTDNTCVCGKRRDYGRIVGGQTAFKFEFPWLAAVVINRPGYGRTPFCGASLINDRYLLSAAHCYALEPIGAEDIQIVLHAHVMDKRRFGSAAVPGWDLPEETDSSEQSVRLDVEYIFTHPLFDGKTFDYDIAILKLKSKINLKKGKLEPICLPTIVEKFVYDTGEELTVSGWGRHDEHASMGARILQKLVVPAVDLPTCQTYVPATSRHICAGYIEGGRDACAGDSGGPLIHKFNVSSNQYMLAGVVSAGVGCARRSMVFENL